MNDLRDLRDQPQGSNTPRGRRIYVKTPPPEFWQIEDANTLNVFLPMADHAEKTARRYGAFVLDGVNLFSSLEKYRNTGDPWHYSSQEYEFSLIWEEYFQDLLQLAQFGMSDHKYNHCCQTFPQFPIGSVPTDPLVANPQISIKPPVSAVVEPTRSNVDPSDVSDFVDMAKVMFIPVDDVRVILQKGNEEDGRQWLGLVYDCIQTLGVDCGEEDTPFRLCASGSVHAKKHINGPRPTSCNTYKSSDRLVTPSIEKDPIVSVPVQQKMLRPFLDREEGGTVRCMTNDVLLFDGCGTHTTLGYLSPDFGHIFRQVFDASLALLPEALTL